MKPGAQMQRNKKLLLEPYAQLYRQIVYKAESLSDDDIAKLSEAVEATTQTNCDWGIYRVAQVLRATIMQQRRKRAETA